MTSVVTRREQDDSGEYSDASQEVEQHITSNDAGQQESDYDSQGSDSEHSEQEDAENQETERKVDDDEDRSNPQYIPKRGTFYEHDDRTAASGEEPAATTTEAATEKEGAEPTPERKRPPRKSDVVNKWSHDKYNENEQMPKSREELVAIYGYDIRNEDAPPHARRNRKYGRGPNKYTRTWEDEEAYRRQTAAQPPHRKHNPEEFPELGAAGKIGRRPRQVRPRSKSQPSSNDSRENGTSLRRNASIKTPKSKPAGKPTPNKAVKQPVKNNKEKMPPIENLTITTSVNNSNNNSTSQQPQRKVNATVAQQRPVPTDQAKRKPQPLTPVQQPLLVNATPSMNPVPAQKSPPQSQQQTQQANAGAETRGGSKRYSSLRQRPLTDTYTPQPQQQSQQQQSQQQPQQQPTPQQQQQQQQHRYHGEFQGTGQPAPQHQGSPAPQIHPQQMMHQVHRNAAVNQPHGPSPPHQAMPQQTMPQQQQQVRLGLMEQQQIVSHQHHSMHNMPPQPHSIGQIPPPAQGYAPPAMMPAQFMQQSGGNAVYGAAPMYAQPPAPYPQHLYQHHNYATQAGGVTYYTCTEQEQPPRTQRRPTAAIPIVRPAHPPHQHPQHRAANSSEKDNIDRIVENMFVRKPWPASSEASKDKENRSSQEPQSKDSSQANSMSSSSISTDSKPSETKEDKPDDSREEEKKAETEKEVKEVEEVKKDEAVTQDA